MKAHFPYIRLTNEEFIVCPIVFQIIVTHAGVNCNLIMKVRYVALLWALPTTHIILYGGSNQMYPVQLANFANHKDCHFLVHESNVRQKV